MCLSRSLSLCVCFLSLLLVWRKRKRGVKEEERAKLLRVRSPSFHFLPIFLSFSFSSSFFLVPCPLLSPSLQKHHVLQALPRDPRADRAGVRRQGSQGSGERSRAERGRGRRERGREFKSSHSRVVVVFSFGFVLRMRNLLSDTASSAFLRLSCARGALER